jgi:hypothetical protein
VRGEGVTILWASCSVAGERVISDAASRFASSTGLVARGDDFVGSPLWGLSCGVMVGRCWCLEFELILELLHSVIYP